MGPVEQNPVCQVEYWGAQCTIEELRKTVEKLTRANAVLRGRLADIASDSAFQPALHAAAGISEADEILNSK